MDSIGGDGDGAGACGGNGDNDFNDYGADDDVDDDGYGDGAGGDEGDVCWVVGVVLLPLLDEIRGILMQAPLKR
ncbi:unnamed protein product [Enterobius vermicularis]|uniref:Uncharacterized protein n=1 Tax=Enterobius vermicularis TaxID=51028 RepID=A0A0N4VRM1_ENTVE|nr:unnamed protein product [Enterobius vermicularis]